MPSLETTSSSSDQIVEAGEFAELMVSSVSSFIRSTELVLHAIEKLMGGIADDIIAVEVVVGGAADVDPEAEATTSPRPPFSSSDLT